MDNIILELKNVNKQYATQAKERIHALKDVRLTFDNTGLIFITGPSGSGKTTLLNIIGGLDKPDNGQVVINGGWEVGRHISLDDYRRDYIGFVFQEYNLLDDFSVFDNISMTVTYTDQKERTKAVDAVLESVGLAGHEKRRTYELSGGQKQRVAIARALAKNCRILLCDEPTGNLDSETGEEILALLKQISKRQLVIVVSHNDEFAERYADRIIRIKDGVVVSDVSRQTEAESGTEADHSPAGARRNKVSGRYIWKCGINTLFSKKLKTSVAVLLYTVSLLLMCTVQIILSYDPIRSVNDYLQDEDMIHIWKDDMYDPNTWKPAETFDSDQYMASYFTGTTGNINIITAQNAYLLDFKEYYFRNDHEPGQGYAYITDYYADVVMKDRSFQAIEFSDYSELADRDIIYSGIPMFKVAGVIKTDYKQYFDSLGRVKRDDSGFENENYYTDRAQINRETDYNCVYMSESTFLSSDMGKDYFSGTMDNGRTMTIKTSGGDFQATRFAFDFIDSKYYASYERFTCLSWDGCVEVDVEDYETRDNLILGEKDIIICGNLYNRLFDQNIDWLKLRKVELSKISRAEESAICRERLPYLNQIVTLTVDFVDREPLVLDGYRIVGVVPVMYEKDDPILRIYGYKDNLKLDNTYLYPANGATVHWSDCQNKIELLEMVRDGHYKVLDTVPIFLMEFESENRSFSYISGIIAVISIVISLIASVNLMNAKIRDKSREIGIMTAIGMKKTEIMAIFMIPMLLILIFGAAISIGCSYGIIHALNQFYQIKPYRYFEVYQVTYITYIVAVAAGAVMLGISLIPLIRLGRTKPVDMIKKQ